MRGSRPSSVNSKKSERKSTDNNETNPPHSRLGGGFADVERMEPMAKMAALHRSARSYPYSAVDDQRHEHEVLGAVLI